MQLESVALIGILVQVHTVHSSHESWIQTLHRCQQDNRRSSCAGDGRPRRRLGLRGGGGLSSGFEKITWDMVQQSNEIDSLEDPLTQCAIDKGSSIPLTMFPQAFVETTSLTAFLVNEQDSFFLFISQCWKS
jgi:hypothetical protein